MIIFHSFSSITCGGLIEGNVTNTARNLIERWQVRVKVGGRRYVVCGPKKYAWHDRSQTYQVDLAILSSNQYKMSDKNSDFSNSGLVDVNELNIECQNLHNGIFSKTERNGAPKIPKSIIDLLDYAQIPTDNESGLYYYDSDRSNPYIINTWLTVDTRKAIEVALTPEEINNFTYFDIRLLGMFASFFV